jgi:hypothetical protein
MNSSAKHDESAPGRAGEQGCATHHEAGSGTRGRVMQSGRSGGARAGRRALAASSHLAAARVSTRAESCSRAAMLRCIGAGAYAAAQCRGGHGAARGGRAGRQLTLFDFDEVDADGGNLRDDRFAQRVGDARVRVGQDEVAVVVVQGHNLMSRPAPRRLSLLCAPARRASTDSHTLQRRAARARTR